MRSACWIPAVAVLLLGSPIPTNAGSGPSAVLQLDARELNSWAPKDLRRDEWVTRTVRVSTGDTLGTFPPSWWDKGPVFQVVRVETPAKVWIRAHPSVVPVAPRLAEAAGESVLVTTVPRMFATKTTDAGLNYKLTVIDSSVTAPMLPVLKSDRRMLGWQELEEAVWSVRLIALGRAIRFRRDSLEHSPANGVVTFLVEEAWKGTAAAGDTIDVVGGLRMATPNQMRVPVFSTPITLGDRVIFFLQEPVADTRKGTMSLWHCALMGQRDSLVFEPRYLGRGVPLDTCRVRMRRAVAELRAPYTGRFLGRIVDAESGVGIPGARIQDAMSRVTVAADDSGRFEIRSLPIGYRQMEISAPCYGTLTGRVPISDETADVLWIAMRRNRAGEGCP